MVLRLGTRWLNASELSVGAAVRDAAGDVGVVEALVIMDAPQIMHNLTVARVATYVVGSGQWVVHNVDLCPIYRGTIREDEVDVATETGWILSDAALDAYALAKKGGMDVDEALKHALSVSRQKYNGQVSQNKHKIMGLANAHTSGVQVPLPRTLISFTRDEDIAWEFGRGRSVVTVDSVDIDNFPHIIDMDGLGLSKLHPLLGDEREILVAHGIKWRSNGTFLRFPE